VGFFVPSCRFNCSDSTAETAIIRRHAYDGIIPQIMFVGGQQGMTFPMTQSIVEQFERTQPLTFVL